jgi:hypothetical protein
MTTLMVTVSGSFHRHMEAIAKAVETFNARGVRVLSPSDPRVVDSVGSFLFVASDKHRSIRLVQDRHLAAISQSDFLWLVSPDGYVGQSASLEIGFAIAFGIPIFCEKLPSDLTLRKYIQKMDDIDEAITRVKAATEGRTYGPSSSLFINPAETLDIAHDQLEVVRGLLCTPGKINQTEIETEIYDKIRDLNKTFILPSKTL